MVIYFIQFYGKRLIINVSKNVEIYEIIYIIYIFERDRCANVLGLLVPMVQ